MNLQLFKVKPSTTSKERIVRVLLPSDYDTSSRHYPVTYALDGQNLFEAKMAFGGRHWKLPETMSKMPKKLQSIIIGIDNAGAGRANEYAPFRRSRQGGGGEQHLHFLIEKLKPAIDSNFRTLPQATDTCIMGSSLGGLLALYAGLRFDQVFGKVGVLSPSLWFNPQVLKLAESSVGIKGKFYLASSRTESKHMASAMQQVYWALRNGGVSDENLRVILRERGKHNEIFWGREYPKMHRWLFS